MSQHDEEDRPQHNVTNASYEVAGGDDVQASSTGIFIPQHWPDDVRAIKR